MTELGCKIQCLLTTFCNPSMRLLTTRRRPLSSWNMVLSSSQDRSHISAPTSSVFWPIMFVVMEGLTSTISVVSLTMLASSGGEKKRRDECARALMQHNLLMENQWRWWQCLLCSPLQMFTLWALIWNVSGNSFHQSWGGATGCCKSAWPFKW